MMVAEKIIQSVGEHLFPDEGSNVFAVLDGAAIPDLLDKLYGDQPEFICLYRGELKPDMAEVAPYLVQLEPDSNFTEWVIDKGWGNHWGIFAITEADIREMRGHFRSFLTVYDADGNPLLFRYYDPRVMRLYLPTCNADELGVIFGPITSYLVEDEDPNTAMRFQVESGSLKQERLQLAT